jgi:hypothetical protein
MEFNGVTYANVPAETALLRIEARLQRTLKRQAISLARRSFGVRIDKRNFVSNGPR